MARVGDVKSSASRCSDRYFAFIREQFDTFEPPLVFTPGDNDWVDCHCADNGKDNPLEAADNLQRITVDGSENATNYVRFTASGNSGAGAPVLTWKKVAFSW